MLSSAVTNSECKKRISEIFFRENKQTNRKTKNPTPRILKPASNFSYFALEVPANIQVMAWNVLRFFSKISITYVSDKFSLGSMWGSPENGNAFFKEQCTCIEANGKARQMRWMVPICLFNKQQNAKKCSYCIWIRLSQPYRAPLVKKYQSTKMIL